MLDLSSRREFLRRTSFGWVGLAAGAMAVGTSKLGLAAPSEQPAKVSRLRTSLNAYSFSKLLNDFNKGLTPGISLLELVDFSAKHDFEGLDPTGYFFPGYPDV